MGSYSLLRRWQDVIGVPLELTGSLLELMLKIALPIFRKRFHSDDSAQSGEVVFFKSVNASNIGHADFFLLSPD